MAGYVVATKRRDERTKRPRGGTPVFWFRPGVSLPVTGESVVVNRLTMSKKIRVFAHGGTRTHYYTADSRRSICQKQMLREYDPSNLPAWDSHEYDEGDVCELCADRVAELTMREGYE